MLVYFQSSVPSTNENQRQEAKDAQANHEDAHTEADALLVVTHIFLHFRTAHNTNIRHARSAVSVLRDVLGVAVHHTESTATTAISFRAETAISPSALRLSQVSAVLHEALQGRVVCCRPHHSRHHSCHHYHPRLIYARLHHPRLLHHAGLHHARLHHARLHHARLI